jgi:antitoxin (DNA-binding transcriptional repressor) of toxin-antitoxin stability system
MREIQASDAKTHLPQILDEVERGETVVITRHGRATARHEDHSRWRGLCSKPRSPSPGPSPTGSTRSFGADRLWRSYVPGLWWFEARNVLIVDERRGWLRETDTALFLRNLARRSIAVMASLSMTPTISRAWAQSARRRDRAGTAGWGPSAARHLVT